MEMFRLPRKTRRQDFLQNLTLHDEVNRDISSPEKDETSICPSRISPDIIGKTEHLRSPGVYETSVCLSEISLYVIMKSGHVASPEEHETSVRLWKDIPTSRSSTET